MEHLNHSAISLRLIPTYCSGLRPTPDLGVGDECRVAGLGVAGHYAAWWREQRHYKRVDGCLFCLYSRLLMRCRLC